MCIRDRSRRLPDPARPGLCGHRAERAGEGQHGCWRAGPAGRSLDGHADSLQPAEDCDVATLRYDVRCDRGLLRAFAAEADTVEADQDPKLAVAVEELAAIAAQAELREPSPTAEETLS